MADTNSVNTSGLWTDYISGGDKSSSKLGSREVNSNLDKDAFLRLLVTQLQYQDPLNPMDDKEFLSQMAQFTSLEQMNNMNASVSKSQAFSMIGKLVIGTIYDEKTNTYEEVAGQVQYVTLKKGEPYLVINGKEMSVNDVENVYEIQLDSINSNVATSQSLNLIGKHIQTIIRDSSGTPIEYIEGIVNYIKFDKGTPILMVGSKEIYPCNVMGISNGNMLLGKPIKTEFGEGTIDSIKYINGEPKVIANGNQVDLEDLAHLSQAYLLVGQEIGYGNISGEVTGIELIKGEVYLNVGNESISYKKYAGIE